MKMRIKYNVLLTAFIALWLVVGVTACSDDNSTGADQEDCNTSLPSEFAPATVDQSYFTEQTEPDPEDEQYSTYFQVQLVATSGGAFFAGGAGPFSLATALLAYAQFSGVTPEFENGSCVWTISPPPSQVDGQDITVTVYATPTGDGVNWEIIYDGELGEDEVVEDFRILAGFTSNNESTGEWNYFVPESSGTPVLTYTWDIESEDNFELNVTAIPTEFGIATINYVKNGAENNITFDDGDEVTNAYWNTETDSGWVELPGEEQRCYTNFVNSACS